MENHRALPLVRPKIAINPAIRSKANDRMRPDKARLEFRGTPKRNHRDESGSRNSKKAGGQEVRTRRAHLLAIHINQPANNQGDDQNVRGIVIVKRVCIESSERLREKKGTDQDPGCKQQPGPPGRTGLGVQDDAPLRGGTKPPPNACSGQDSRS